MVSRGPTAPKYVSSTKSARHDLKQIVAGFRQTANELAALQRQHDEGRRANRFGMRACEIVVVQQQHALRRVGDLVTAIVAYRDRATRRIVERRRAADAAAEGNA